MNARVVYPLLRPTLHAVNWLPLVVGAVVGTGLVLVPEALTARLTATHLALLLRLAAGCAALGAAFVLDDPATRSIPTVPTARLVRAAVRAVPAVAGLAVWWFALLGVTISAAHHPAVTRLPGSGLTLEAAAMVTAALALAAIAHRRTGDGTGGVIAAPALLVLIAAAWVLPSRVALVVGPGDPNWAVAHRRWAVVLAAAVVAFLVAGHERAGHR